MQSYRFLKLKIIIQRLVTVMPQLDLEAMSVLLERNKHILVTILSRRVSSSSYMVSIQRVVVILQSILHIHA